MPIRHLLGTLGHHLHPDFSGLRQQPTATSHHPGRLPPYCAGDFDSKMAKRPPNRRFHLPQTLDGTYHGVSFDGATPKPGHPALPSHYHSYRYPRTSAGSSDSLRFGRCFLLPPRDF